MGPGHSPNSPSPSCSSCGCKWANQGFKKKKESKHTTQVGNVLVRWKNTQLPKNPNETTENLR